MTDEKKSELAREGTKKLFFAIADCMNSDVKRIVIKDLGPGEVMGVAQCERRKRSKKVFFMGEKK